MLSSDNFNQRKRILKEKVLEQLILTKDAQDNKLLEEVDKVILEEGRQSYISIDEKVRLRTELFNTLRRLDVLQELIEDKEITEIMINGSSTIFIEKSGRIMRYQKEFESDSRLEEVIQAIVSKTNRIVNESSPIVDARLEDGSRVNVVLPPIALNGPVVTIRKFPEKPIDMEGLITLGAITQEAVEFLKLLVKARYNIFISGGTGSGKTTFLNALSNFIPEDERIITIEDSAELQIRNITNLVRLECRNANLEGKNEITIRDLIKSSLRMRPDRIILGEVRDAAAIDLLAAYNTGHDGSLSTGHANSTLDMISRLEALVLQGADMPLQAIRKQIGSAIDIIIHLGRLRDKSRKVLEISEVIGAVSGEVRMNVLYQFQSYEKGEEGVGELVRTDNLLMNVDKLERAGLYSYREHGW
ncbi:MAG TPA: CpaF family protein [Lachnospiraceae bacterium]|nr:CpaF family protein [Lachnospiraceae bacterium]